MKILIIEDEPIAAQRMQMMLKQYDVSIEIMGCLETVEDSVNWLQANPHPDLLLLDIQLTDGFSFDIFKKITYKKPVIFTTAYNEYALEAFRYLSIDYLLKPVTFQTLQQALNKYKLITNQPEFEYTEIFKVLKKLPSEQYKERFLARIGHKLIFVKTCDIAYFRAEDKIVYLIDKQANRLPVDYSLEKLEAVLDPRNFFRLNRKIIIAIDSIAQIKPYPNSRLILCLKGFQKSEEIIISRDRVPEFRQWAEQ